MRVFTHSALVMRQFTEKGTIGCIGLAVRVACTFAMSLGKTGRPWGERPHRWIGRVTLVVAITVTGVLLTVVNSKRAELVTDELADQVPLFFPSSVQAAAHGWARAKKLCSSCHRGDSPEAEDAVPHAGHAAPVCGGGEPPACAERHLPD